MGRAQVMQAEASGIAPDVRMNPILLKPTSDQGSQVIVNGEVWGNLSAKEYYHCKASLIPTVMEAFQSLSAEYDIIVIEGAGSPAEINLKSQDIVNMGMAQMAGAPVIIVGDIDRGGVFAALAGTMLLLEDDEKKLVKGTIINKFRGDKDILEPGLRMLEKIIKVPVVGVVPYMKLDVDDEDSLTDRFLPLKEKGMIDIVVIRLPRISNFTDFNPFEYMNGVSLRYVGSVGELGDPDLIILPGTKNTMSDLLWLRQSGMEAALLKYASLDKPIFGICGGYQMLGMTIRDPYGVEHGGEMAGLGLLDADTVFEAQKNRTRVTGRFQSIRGIFQNLTGIEFEGYEIHMGATGLNNVSEPMTILTDREGTVKTDGLSNVNVYGCYVHGLFDKEEVTRGIVEALLKKKGLDFECVAAFDIVSYKQQQYDLLADELRKSLDMKLIYQILNEGI